MRTGRRIATFVTAGLMAIGIATADAAIIRFGADLDPEAAGATGDGSVTVDYDDVEYTLRIVANWTGLSGTTTIAHIHCCVAPPGTAGIAVTPTTLPGFPVGLNAGSYTSPLIDLDLASSFTTTFVNQFGGGTLPGATSALLAGMSGGTAASGFAIADAMSDPAVRRIMRNPHALDPDPDGPHPKGDNRLLGWDPTLKMFFVPFFMAATNSPVVRRGHALAGFPWGRDFVYREVMSTPGNARGAIMAATAEFEACVSVGRMPCAARRERASPKSVSCRSLTWGSPASASARWVHTPSTASTGKRRSSSTK